MGISEIREANKEAWEKTAEIHKRVRMEELIKNFKEPYHSVLDNIETDVLIKTCKVKNKDVIQLCCNNGRELISIKYLGAKRCVGVDFAKGFISQGEELSELAKQEIEFYCLDIFELPRLFYNSFDVVYISVGAICWISDLNKFMKLVYSLLRVGGYLLLYDMHPILSVFESQSENPIIPKYNYFDKDPFVEEEGYDYYDKEALISSKTYVFQHTLEEIFMTSIKNKLQIQDYKEYQHDISDLFDLYEKFGLPLSFILVSMKIEF
jgi:SAM-dependent methyltransferase